MKKYILPAIILFFASAPHVFAQGFVPLTLIPNLTEGVAANTAGLANFFNNLYKYLIGLAATIAVIEIIWGGLQISTQDSVSKQGEGRERITQAILGLILVLSPYLVFSIINPNILNLSLSLPELKTASGTSGGGEITASVKTEYIGAAESAIPAGSGYCFRQGFNCSSDFKTICETEQEQCTTDTTLDSSMSICGGPKGTQTSACAVKY